VGDDRTEEAVRPFFTQEMGTRRCRTLRVVCMDEGVKQFVEIMFSYNEGRTKWN
jgi:hypothetical protein